LRSTPTGTASAVYGFALLSLEILRKPRKFFCHHHFCLAVSSVSSCKIRAHRCLSVVRIIRLRFSALCFQRLRLKPRRDGALDPHAEFNRPALWPRKPGIRSAPEVSFVVFLGVLRSRLLEIRLFESIWGSPPSAAFPHPRSPRHPRFNPVRRSISHSTPHSSLNWPVLCSLTIGL